MQQLKALDFDDFSEWFPAFLIIVLIPLTGSISVGLAFGFAAYPLNGLDIINSYTLYDGTCSKNIKNIESFYLSEGYEAMIPTNLNLYTGASSKMYEALWIPNEMTSFSNQIYTKNLTPYWVRYQF